jgi:hypothetical protein
MLTEAQVDGLLNAEESEEIERKSSHSDRDSLRDSILAFANDLVGRARGWIIIGQDRNKNLVGVNVSDDELQQTVSEIARNRCFPAIAVSIEFHTRHSKRLAFVEVRASVARPHFAGRCLVRIGSTNRQATDAEIISLRFLNTNSKLGRLARWLAEGKSQIAVLQLPHDQRGSAYESDAQLIEVNEDYIVLKAFGSDVPATLPVSEFEIGYNFKKDRPMISYRIRPLV